MIFVCFLVLCFHTRILIFKEIFMQGLNKKQNLSHKVNDKFTTILPMNYEKPSGNNKSQHVFTEDDFFRY